MTAKTLARNNAPILILAFAYIVTIATFLRLVPNGGAFLRLCWFNAKLFLLGMVCCLACLAIQILVPKLRKTMQLENYINFFIIILILPIYQSTFASYKQYITDDINNSYDVLFMKIDSMTNFGHAPWLLLKFILNSDILLRCIDILYLMWFVFLIVFSVWMGISRLHNLRKRFFVTTIIIWSVFGSGLGSLLYSVGPCYYAAATGDPGPYTPLMERLRQANAKSMLFAVKNQEILWEAKKGHHWLPFGGISAMPSVHVAMAVLFALTLGEAFPLLRATGWLYALCVQIGSVVLAWHYAIDGYVAALLTLAVWKLLRRLDACPRADKSPPPDVAPAP